MSKPRPVALDLCCGRGGWTQALLDAGFEVIGVDIVRFKDYPAAARFLWCDVKTLLAALKCARNPRSLISRRVRVVFASPPCTEFSKFDNRSLFPNQELRTPDLSLVDACRQIANILCVPIVLENVRGAQAFLGTAAAHYGSFYLWGDVPVILPSVPGRQGRPKLKLMHRSASLRAKIPNELAQYLARYYYGLCAKRSAKNNVSNAVSDRVQRLATSNGTERFADRLASDSGYSVMPETEQQNPVPESRVFCETPAIRNLEGSHHEAPTRRV